MEHVLSTRNRRAATRIAAVLLAAGLTGCPLPPGGVKIAVINYHQVGACKTATLPDGAVTAPASQAIALFVIDNIDNTKPDVAWTFNAAKLQINPPSDTQANLGTNNPAVAVPANGTVTVGQPVGIMIATGNADGTDAATTNYTLLYPQEGTAPGTISVNASRDQHSFPWNPDCNALIGG